MKKIINAHNVVGEKFAFFFTGACRACHHNQWIMVNVRLLQIRYCLQLCAHTSVQAVSFIAAGNINRLWGC